MATAGLVNVAGAGAATGDPLVARAQALSAHAYGDTWAPSPKPRTGVAPAASVSVTVNDFTGDTEGGADARADIEQTQAGVDGGGAVFRTRLHTPTNPSSWSTSGATLALWLIDSDFTGRPDLVAFLLNTPDGPRAVLGTADDESRFVCNGSPGYDGTWIQVSFGTCGGRLHAFQWQSAMFFNDIFDSAPDDSSGPITAPHRNGYFMLGKDGKNYGFGGGPNFGGTVPFATAFATRHDGTGLWIVDASGHVFTRGRAPYKGGAPHLASGEVVSAIANTPNDAGYLLFTNRGRAFAFGNAHTHGDLSGHHLNGPIIAAVITPTGNGYYMVGSDGGIFTFGDAHYRGSMGGRHLNARIVGIAPTPDNKGYWLVGSDGGVFSFGTASFRGSMGGHHLNAPINGLIAYGNGYLMVASDGGVFVFSNRRFLGSLGGKKLSAPIIDIKAFSV